MEMSVNISSPVVVFSSFICISSSHRPPQLSIVRGSLSALPQPYTIHVPHLWRPVHYHWGTDKHSVVFRWLGSTRLSAQWQTTFSSAAWCSVEIAHLFPSYCTWPFISSSQPEQPAFYLCVVERAGRRVGFFFFFRKPCQLTFSGKLAEETLGLESHREEYDLVGLDLDKCQNDRISRKMTNSSSHCPPEIHISARTKRTPLYITACVSAQVRIETYVCTETNWSYSYRYYHPRIYSLFWALLPMKWNVKNIYIYKMNRRCCSSDSNK